VNDNKGTEWIFEYFSEQWQRYYLGSARKYCYPHNIEAEDFCQEAQETLITKLRGSVRENVSDAFVKTVYRNILIDLLRSRLGRPRPPKWVKDLGQMWLDIYDFFCVRMLPLDKIVELLQHRRARTGLNPGAVDEKSVENVVKQLQQRDACAKPRPKPVPLERQREDGSPGRELAVDSEGDPLRRLSRGELQGFLQGLFAMFGVNEAQGEGASTQVEKRWEKLEIQIDDEERLLMRLVYDEDLTVTEAARILGLKYHSARRMLKRVLERIHEVLLENGIDFDRL
jgi:RNA polymerase sigma factor (sigma-70 family)